MFSAVAVKSFCNWSCVGAGMILLVESCAGAVLEDPSRVEESVAWILRVACPFVTDKPAAQMIALRAAGLAAESAEGRFVVDADFEAIVIEASAFAVAALCAVTFSNSLRMDL